MKMSRYKTIVVENKLDELDILGLLLEKYMEGLTMIWKRIHLPFQKSLLMNSCKRKNKIRMLYILYKEVSENG